MICNICPNNCNVNRKESLGICLSPEDMIINRIAPHFFEEPPISGTLGSGTIFFGGCTMKCSFCQNYEISKKPSGKEFSPDELACKLKELEGLGVHNINFVTPTHYSHKIRETLDIYRPNIPIVYNTSGYELTEVIQEMEKYVDIYLPDMKYASSDLAKKYSGRYDYPKYAISAISEMFRQKKNTYDSNGLMKTGVIIRHMILPGHSGDSINVLKLIKDNLGTEVTLSLMSQFTPMPSCPELPSTLKPLEYKLVINKAREMGFEDVFIQEMSSAQTSYIPKWNEGL
ncbi:MAG: radical SAM protein [Clostridiales bacterium]|nr:radical SAM protein [Clostridiales bacterium]